MKWRYGPEPSPAGPLAMRPEPDGGQAPPASVKPGGVAVTRDPSTRLITSIPRGDVTATRAPSAEKEANEQSVRIPPGLNRSGGGRQWTESRGRLRRTAASASGSGSASAAPLTAPVTSSSRRERFRLNGGSD